MNRNLCFALLAISVAIPACRTSRLVNPDPMAAAQSKDATRSSILTAMQDEHWALADETPGVLHAARNIKGKHDMTVAISYDDKQVSLKYEKSEGLKYSRESNGDEYIHQNYNVWVNRLWAKIREEIGHTRAAAVK